jgi:adenosine deaminase
MDAQHAYRLAANSFEGSFAQVAAKKSYLEKLEAVFSSAATNAGDAL